MQVLNFFSDKHRETMLDVFVYEPFEFDMEYSGAMLGELFAGLCLQVCIHPQADPHERKEPTVPVIWTTSSICAGYWRIEMATSKLDTEIDWSATTWRAAAARSYAAGAH